MGFEVFKEFDSWTWGRGVPLAGDLLVAKIEANLSAIDTIEKATARSVGFVVGIPLITGTSIQNGDC